MHRTDSPDFVVVAGKRYYKESPSPASIFGYHGANALQEEIAGVIEAESIALRASGALDAVAGYTGQLNQAIDQKVSNLESTLQSQIDTLNGNVSNLITDVTNLKAISEPVHAKYINGCELRRWDAKTVSVYDGYLVIVIPSTGKLLYVQLTNSMNKKILNTGGTAFEAFAPGNGNGGVPSGVSGPTQNEFYYVYAVKSESDPVEIMLDSSGFASNALTAYNTAYSVGGVTNIGHRYLGMLQILDPAETSVFEIKSFRMVENSVFWTDTYTTIVQIINGAEPGGEQHDLDKDIALKPTYGRTTPAYKVGNIRAISVLDFDMFASGGTGADLLVYKYLGGLWQNPSRFTVFKDAGDNENLTKCYVNEILYVDSNNAVKMSTSTPSTTDMNVHSHTLGYIDSLRGKV